MPEMRHVENRGERMREHLYKGRGLGNWLGKWLEGHYFIDVIDDEDRQGFIKAHYIMAQYGDHYQRQEVDPETVSEYTGLLDKNGMKIFEGDIVKSEISIGDVQFSHGMFGIEWTRAKADKSMVGSWGQLHNLRRMDDGFNEEVEIIGNVHDNPELLEANYFRRKI